MSVQYAPPKVESWERTLSAFRVVADALEPLQPGERQRVLAAAICLFDIEVASSIVERWRLP